MLATTCVTASLRSQRLARRLVRGQLDPRQRQQIVDQARHAVRLLGHDLEEALARLASWRAGPRRVSMKPWIEASGVRISWLALATKSDRIRSIISCSVCSRSASKAPRRRSPRSSGSIRAANCLVRSLLGVNETLLAEVPASAAVAAARTPGSRRIRASGRSGAVASKLRRAAALA